MERSADRNISRLRHALFLRAAAMSLRPFLVSLATVPFALSHDRRASTSWGMNGSRHVNGGESYLVQVTYGTHSQKGRQARWSQRRRKADA
jgi:hypothetical protein